MKKRLEKACGEGKKEVVGNSGEEKEAVGTRDPSKKKAVGNFWEKEAAGTRASL